MRRQEAVARFRPANAGWAGALSLLGHTLALLLVASWLEAAGHSARNDPFCFTLRPELPGRERPRRSEARETPPRPVRSTWGFRLPVPESPHVRPPPREEWEFKHKAEGDQDAISNIPLGGVGFLDFPGEGGGAAGAYGWRTEPANLPRGQQEKSEPRCAANPLSPAALSAINAALRWLARNQEADGRWDCFRHGGRLARPGQRPADYDVAVTALALLAFAAGGYAATPAAPPEFRPALERAWRWLGTRQRADGSWAALNYAQHLATLATIRQYRLTGDGRFLAERGLAAVLARQDQTWGGWDYGAPAGRRDTPISVWGALVLGEARQAGLAVPAQAFYLAQNHFIAACCLPGGVWYSLGPGGERRRDAGGALQPAAALALLVLGLPAENPWLAEARVRLARRGANLDNLYELYHATAALRRLDGEEWPKHFPAARAGLLAAQRRLPPDAGSWPAARDRWGFAGGVVYTTALGALTLAEGERR